MAKECMRLMIEISGMMSVTAIASDLTRIITCLTLEFARRYAAYPRFYHIEKYFVLSSGKIFFAPDPGAGAWRINEQMI